MLIFLVTQIKFVAIKLVTKKFVIKLCPRTISFAMMAHMVNRVVHPFTCMNKSIEPYSCYPKAPLWISGCHFLSCRLNGCCKSQISTALNPFWYLVG